MEELVPIWVHGPLIFDGALLVADDELVFGVVFGVALEVRAAVSVTLLAAVLLAGTTDLAGPRLTEVAWRTAGAAPAELIPRPMPVPATPAPIASTASALHLRFFMASPLFV